MPRRLQNSPYFCVFKYARAVKQKVWNEAENRERDWGDALRACEARAVRAHKTLTPRVTDFFTDFEEKPDCFAVYMPRGGVKKEKKEKRERSVADRESSIALCHRVALKKEREIGRGPREQYRSVPRGSVKKKKDRSRTERAVSLCATGWR